MRDVYVFEVYTSRWRQEWGLDKTTREMPNFDSNEMVISSSIGM
jgi:hypothetical protein